MLLTDLKIRIWLPNEKVMYYPTPNFFGKESIGYLYGNENWNQEAICMRSTRIKDIKDTEVYEGDITELSPYGLYIVEYHFTEFKLIPIHHKIDNLDQYSFPCLNGFQDKIIGNIYENAELIEEKLKC